ncbi:MAG: hypothetical protein WCP60_09570 [bacterium]
MKQTFLSITLIPFVLVAATTVFAAMDMADQRLMPDTIVLNDGTKLHGMIVKNDAKEVVLQQRMGEVEIPKENISRICDEADAGVYFADIVDPGKLPPWRMIVQDLRTDDNIHSFTQIPPTTIENGYLKNIPYLSFRINKHVEMNVYGNPEDPVCLEFGIYEKGEKITRFKKIIREYLAGTLRSRAEIAALYALDEKGDERQVGSLRFRISPPTSPDAYGGWWIAVYDPKRLEKERISDAAYSKVTLPFNEVNGKNGKLLDDRNMNHAKFLEKTMMNWSQMIPDLRGFYRNKMGDLKLLTSPNNTR